MSNIPNYDSNNISSELRPEHHVHDSSEPLPGAAGGRSGPDYGVGNTDTSSGFGGDSRLQDRLGGFDNSTPEGGRAGLGDSTGNMNTGSGFGASGGGSRLQDRLGGFDNSTPEGGRAGLGDSTGNMNTGSGFGASGGAQPQSKFGDFETTTIGGRGGADPSADNMDIGSGVGGGAQPQDWLGGFESSAAKGAARGDAPDYSAETTDIGSGFGGGGTQRQDGLSEFGKSELGTSTGVDKPAKVDFGDKAKDYDSSGNDFSASYAGKPENLMATGDTTRGAEGGTGGGLREHEPARVEPSTGGDTTGERQSRKAVSAATESTTPGTRETQGTQETQRTRGTQGGTGVGRREQEHAPAAKPGVGDKIAGGAQKLVGKVMNNPGLQQKGELRETGGKSAVN